MPKTFLIIVLIAVGYVAGLKFPQLGAKIGL